MQSVMLLAINLDSLKEALNLVSYEVALVPYNTC